MEGFWVKVRRREVKRCFVSHSELRMARFFQTEDGSLKKRQSDVLTVVSYAVHPA